MPNIYKTAQGKLINMDNLRLANEDTRAVSNTALNAKGDEIRSDGTVIKTKQEAVRERNHEIKNMVQYNQKKKTRN